MFHSPTLCYKMIFENNFKTVLSHFYKLAWKETYNEKQYSNIYSNIIYNWSISVFSIQVFVFHSRKALTAIDSVIVLPVSK